MIGSFKILWSEKFASSPETASPGHGHVRQEGGASWEAAAVGSSYDVIEGAGQEH